MKKVLTALTVGLLLCVCAQSAELKPTIRVVGGQPDTNNVFAITVNTDYARLSSIICDVTATGETNSFTITTESIMQAGATYYTNTYTYATAVTDQIAAAETASYYNSDSDITTDDTAWLKKGDVLKLTANDGTQTDYSNIVYRVVLEGMTAR